MYFPTQQDINALFYKEKTILVRVLLLNNEFQTVNSLEGEYVSGDMSIDTDSDVRNTMSFILAAVNPSIGFAEDKKLWIDKFVKIFIGFSSPLLREPLWYDKGIFVMTDYNYDITNYSVQVNCSDLVCMLNGEVGGALEGLETIIYEEDKHTIREAIISTLEDLSPFKKYNIVDMPKLIPYDLEFSATNTVWDILVKLRDLYSGYEMFFDTDGTFICQQITTKESDPVVLDDTVLQNLYISGTITGDLQRVRNVSKVWGKCLEEDYYTETCLYDTSTNTYMAYFDDIAINDNGSLPTSTKFAVKIPEVNTADAPKLKIYIRDISDAETNEEDDTETEKELTGTLITTLPIVDSVEESVKKDFFIKDSTFVFRTRRNAMYVLGQWQIFAVNKLRNTEPTEEEKNADKEKHGCDDITYTIIPESPFSIEKIGERLQAYAGGEYDDIQAIDDCITRAEYETWKSAKIGYTVSLEMIYIPWLNGNEKIRFTLPETNTKDWMITNIQSSLLSGVMTLNITEFEPLYNFDVEEDEEDEENTEEDSESKDDATETNKTE